MSKPTWQQVLRYRFDAFMAHGGRSIFLSLLVVFLSLLTFLDVRPGFHTARVEDLVVQHRRRRRCHQLQPPLTSRLEFFLGEGDRLARELHENHEGRTSGIPPGPP